MMMVYSKLDTARASDKRGLSGQHHSKRQQQEVPIHILITPIGPAVVEKC
jgi:hypothetical protein